jgi:hypothetical protein
MGRPGNQVGWPLRIAGLSAGLSLKIGLSAGSMDATIYRWPRRKDRINKLLLTAQYFSPNHLVDLSQVGDRQDKTEPGHLQQGCGLCHGQSQTASSLTSPATGARHALAPYNDSLK